jgi:hypothetical protein
MTMTRSGQPGEQDRAAMTSREEAILAYLRKTPGHTVTYQQIALACGIQPYTQANILTAGLARRNPRVERVSLCMEPATWRWSSTSPPIAALLHADEATAALRHLAAVIHAQPEPGCAIPKTQVRQLLSQLDDLANAVALARMLLNPDSTPPPPEYRTRPATSGRPEQEK